MTKRNKASAARETVYDRCAYVGCYNGKFINGRRLFHFPAETDRRLEMWIERSGNFRLRTWAATSLRKAGLCSDHFDEKSFTDPTRKALRRNVVPRHYMEDLKYRKGCQENRDNNENEKDIIPSENEDDPINCGRSLSDPSDFIVKEQNFADNICDESSTSSDEYILDEPCKKAPRLQSPSPLVEFIVEELDESLICDQSQYPIEESIYEDEGEEQQVEQEVEQEQYGNIRNETMIGSSISFEEMREITKPIIKESGLKVNKSSRGVRTYYRSKHHLPSSSEESQQLNQELSREESEMISDEENMVIPQSTDVTENMSALPTTQIIHLNNTACSNKNHEKILLNLHNENKQLRKTMGLLKQNLRRSKAREANYMRVRDMITNIDEFLNIQECTNPVARAMVKLALHKHKAPYEKEEKDFATQLYRTSSAAFMRLRRAGCNFPGKSTMKRWIAEANGETSTCNFTSHEPEGLGDEANEAVDDVVGVIDDVNQVIGTHDVDSINESMGCIHEVILDMHEEVVDMHKEAIDNMNGTVVEREETKEAIVGMNEASEDVEEAIDQLVENLEVQIENAQGHRVYRSPSTGSRGR